MHELKMTMRGASLCCGSTSAKPWQSKQRSHSVEASAPLLGASVQKSVSSACSIHRVNLFCCAYANKRYRSRLCAFARGRLSCSTSHPPLSSVWPSLFLAFPRRIVLVFLRGLASHHSRCREDAPVLSLSLNSRSTLGRTKAGTAPLVSYFSLFVQVHSRHTEGRGTTRKPSGVRSSCSRASVCCLLVRRALLPR